MVHVGFIFLFLKFLDLFVLYALASFCCFSIRRLLETLIEIYYREKSFVTYNDLRVTVAVGE